MASFCHLAINFSFYRCIVFLQIALAFANPINGNNQFLATDEIGWDAASAADVTGWLPSPKLHPRLGSNLPGASDTY